MLLSSSDYLLSPNSGLYVVVHAQLGWQAVICCCEHTRQILMNELPVMKHDCLAKDVHSYHAQ